MLGHERHAVLGTLAHELRGPLAPLRNAAHVIRTVAGTQPEIAASLEIIDRQIDFIESVVRDLLESTRVGVGKAALHCERVEVAKLVGKAVETCSAALRERSQKTEVLLTDGLTIEADPVRLQQVLVNLIQNASKFSPPQSHISISGTSDSTDMILSVADRGNGIAPHLLPKIFDLFSQGDTDGGRPEQGLGLGLGIVKTLVELHGGTVDARSDGVGKGTEVVVRLPVSRSRAHQ